MTRKTAVLVVAGILLGILSIRAAAQTQIRVYGAWHCYTDGCSWASVPNMTTLTPITAG